MRISVAGVCPATGVHAFSGEGVPDLVLAATVVLALPGANGADKAARREVTLVALAFVAAPVALGERWLPPAALAEGKPSGPGIRWAASKQLVVMTLAMNIANLISFILGILFLMLKIFLAKLFYAYFGFKRK